MCRRATSGQKLVKENDLVLNRLEAHSAARAHPKSAVERQDTARSGITLTFTGARSPERKKTLQQRQTLPFRRQKDTAK
jgi:hypothetical protein